MKSGNNLNHNKGAWQPAFIFLSWVQAKRKTADCFASLAMTDYRCVTASPRYLNSRNSLNVNKGARQPSFGLLFFVNSKDKKQISTPFAKPNLYPTIKA